MYNPFILYHAMVLNLDIVVRLLNYFLIVHSYPNILVLLVGVGEYGVMNR